jgi:ABC-type nitrate/sulfonate/bicarbonate transport system permease component
MPLVRRAIVVLVLVAAWQWALPVLLGAGPGLLPRPTDVAHGLAGLLTSARFWRSVATSLGRVLAGFGLATAAGVLLGIAMGVAPRVEALVDLTIEALRPLPAMAWIPIAILWFGVGDLSSVFLVALGAFFPVVLNTAAGARATERAYRKAALTTGAGAWLRFRRVTLPGSLPWILLGCRVGLGVGWMVIVSAEMVGAQSGLGFLIMEARSFARIDWVVGCMIVIGLIGIGLDTALERLQRRAAPWWGTVAV